MKIKNIFKIITKAFNDPDFKMLEENGFAKALGLEGTKKHEVNAYWTALSIRAITKSITASEIGFFQVQGDKIIEASEDSFAVKQFKKPDGKLTFNKWLKKLFGVYLLNDEVFIFMEGKNIKGQANFHIVSKDDITFFANGTSNVRVEKINYTGVKKEELIQYINPDFTSETRPLMLTKKIEKWIDSDGSLNDLFIQVARNGSVTGGILETPINADKELEKAKIDWKANYAGFAKNVADIILPKGYKYTSQNVAPKDVNLETLMDKSSKNILMAWNVPASLLGVADGKGRANMEAEQNNFYKNTTLPLLEELKEIFNDEIFPAIGITDVFFGFNSPVKDDEEIKAKIRQIETGGKAWKTPNEIREEMDLKPMDGNDDLNPDPIKDYLQRQENQQGKLFDSAPTRIKRALIANRNKKNIKKSRTALVKAFDEFLKKDQVEKEKLIDEYVEKKSVRNLVVIDQVTKELSELKREATNGMVENILSGKIKEIKIKSIDSSVLKKLFKDVVAVEGEETMNTIKESKEEFNPDDKELKKELDKIYSIRSESWDDTTKNGLLKIAKEGLENGTPQKDLAKIMGAFLGKRLADGVYTLAHDIVFTMTNEASNSAMIQSRVVTTKRWYAVGDERTCPQCGVMHGRSIPVGEKFLKKGEKYTGTDGKVYKADFGNIKHPPIHPSCRCGLIAEGAGIG